MHTDNPSRKVRQRPAWLRALGDADPPDTIHCDGLIYRRVEIYKHDSWAATGRYTSVGPAQGSAGAQPLRAQQAAQSPTSASPPTPHCEIVCKFNRQQRLGCLPMGWLGRWLARREATAYRRLSGISGVAAACGPVTTAEGKCLKHAVAHEYIPGVPLSQNVNLQEEFFEALSQTLQEVHRAGIAYVDLHKRENVLVADDGSPFLIDFQVSFQAASGWPGRLSLNRWILERLQGMDRFCFAKHVRLHRPDQLETLGLQDALEPPAWLRAHRSVAAPLRSLRRRILTWLRVRDASGRAASEQFAEHAFRR